MSGCRLIPPWNLMYNIRCLHFYQYSNLPHSHKNCSLSYVCNSELEFPMPIFPSSLWISLTFLRFRYHRIVLSKECPTTPWKCVLVPFLSGIPAKVQLKKRFIYFGSKGLYWWAKNDGNKVRLLAQIYQVPDREDWPFLVGFLHFFFVKFRDPGNEVVLTTFKVDLLISVKTSESSLTNMYKVCPLGESKYSQV